MIDKLRDIITFSVEDQDSNNIVSIMDIGLNTFNVVVENTFFINSFMMHEYSSMFELQEIYNQHEGRLSLYVKVIDQ